VLAEYLARAKGPGKICIDNVVPELLGEIERRGALDLARAVDQDVIFTKRSDRIVQ